MAMHVSRRGGDQPTCEVNTTPLIDVMLVLLVMLIVTLPTQTHVVKLNMPVGSPPAIPPRAININIDIDSDGTIVWNSEPLSGIGALEAHFRQESTKDPQAQIRLRPSARANYGVIANVMASAQRNNMTHMGFSNIVEFAD